MCEWQMWHLTSFVCESVSCSSLDDANTLSDKAACVDCHIVSVEIRITIFSQVYRLYRFLLRVAVLMRRLSVNRNKSVKKRDGVKEEKHRVKHNVLIACIDVPIKKISFQRSCFSWFPADERQNYSANSESIGPDYFSVPVQRWAKCQRDARQQRAVFEAGPHLFTLWSSALLLYFHISLSLF